MTIAARPPDFISTQVSTARRFFLDLQPRTKTGLTVVCGGCEHCAPGYVVDRRDFPYHGLEFVARGEGRLALAGRSYPLRPGMVFAYGPGVPHRIENAASAPMTKYFVDFVGTRAKRLLARTPLRGWQAVQVSDPGQVADLFEQLTRNGDAGSRFSGEICASLLEVLLLKIAEKAAVGVQDDPRALIAYQRCRRHLQEHFATLRTLEEAAAASHVNAAYLCRLFARFDHVTPYHYLLRLKMNHAAGLLLESGALVKEVAGQLGFADPFHFSRVFKATFGLSPRKFVQQARAG